MEAGPVSDPTPQVAVIVPCWNEDKTLLHAVGSLHGEQGVEVVVVDDGSTDAGTKQLLSRLEAGGCRVLRQDANQGVSAARNRGLEETTAPYVFPLDADDLAIPGALRAMAGKLESEPTAGVCYGDYLEFGTHELLRAVPDRIDAYRLAFTNEYPISALFRRSVLEQVGGWRRLLPEIDSRQDWSLWLSLAEAEVGGIHIGAGVPTYARRMHAGRLAHKGRRHQRRLYAALRARHPGVFGDLRRQRERSSLSPLRARLYPLVYGGRPRAGVERTVKKALDRLGLWTLTAELTERQRRDLEAAVASGTEGAGLVPIGSGREAG